MPGGLGSSDDARAHDGASAAAHRVLVVDDQTVFAELLGLALGGERDLEVVGTASSAAQAVEAVDRLDPDLVLMDAHLGRDDGVATTALLTQRHPGVRVLVLTGHVDSGLATRAAAAGACALVDKDGDFDSLLGMIRTARVGGFLLQPKLVEVLHRGPVETGYVPLTPREHEILELLATGCELRSIAEQAHLSLHTVRGHLKSILLKLDAHTQLEAVTKAVRQGLVRIPLERG